MEEIPSKYLVRSVPEQLDTLNYFRLQNNMLPGFLLVSFRYLDNDKNEPYLEIMEGLIKEQLIILFTVDFGILLLFLWLISSV